MAIANSLFFIVDWEDEGVLILPIHPPPIAFTDLKVFADSVAIEGTDGTLQKSINHSNSITLDYKKIHALKWADELIILKFPAL